MFEKIYRVVFDNFLMPSRLDEYSSFLDQAIKLGFSIVPMRDFLENLSFYKNQKVIVLRHDIEFSGKENHKIYEIEKRHGIKSTYFFRNSSVSRKLIKELIKEGNEVGFHYETLSNYIKKSGDFFSIDSPGFFFLENLFQRELNEFINLSQITPYSFAAHGDFCNRLCGKKNTDVFTDRIREQTKGKYEAYDNTVMKEFDVYISDRAGSMCYYPKSIFDALKTDNRIYLLIHPNKWKVNLIRGIGRVLFRFLQGARFSFRLFLFNKKFFKHFFMPQTQLVFGKHFSNEHLKTYIHFTKPHPKLPLFKRKQYGAALVDKERFGNFETYSQWINGKSSPNYFARRAKAQGYSVVFIDRNKYIDDIYAINTSKPFRQGRPMEENYLIKEEKYVNLPGFIYLGVVDINNKLVAYSVLQKFKNFISIQRIIGHAEYLKHGVMYMMVLEAMKIMFQSDSRYLMYDMYWGGSEGLRLFKTKFSFLPYYINSFVEGDDEFTS